jgi:hypothetical protein
VNSSPQSSIGKMIESPMERRMERLSRMRVGAIGSSKDLSKFGREDSAGNLLIFL